MLELRIKVHIIMSFVSLIACRLICYNSKVVELAAAFAGKWWHVAMLHTNLTCQLSLEANALHYPFNSPAASKQH
jgi:hypothetical protein